MHSAASNADLFEREDWWQIIDTIGLSSSGSREKLVSLTSATLVDEGVPQQSIQLLPYVPTLLTKLGSQGVLMTQLLAKDDARLKSRDSAPYILGRSTDGNDLVGGVCTYFKVLIIAFEPCFAPQNRSLEYLLKRCDFTASLPPENGSTDFDVINRHAPVPASRSGG